MSQKKIVINGLLLNYKGVFEFTELLKVIHRYVTERGYKWHEKKSEEKVMPGGKEIFIELRPIKKKIEYYALMIKIRITMGDIKEIKVTLDGRPKIVQQGDIGMIFDAWTTTDYAMRWGEKPWFYFLKALINKFVYKFPLEESFIGEVAEDTRHVHRQVSAFLNLYKYKVK